MKEKPSVLHLRYANLYTL